jgi:hypothetical protein
VPAPEIETLVLGAVWAGLRQDGSVQTETPETDRDLIERQVQRVIVGPQEIRIELMNQHMAGQTSERLDPTLVNGSMSPVLSVPWPGANGAMVKGIVHSPSLRPTMAPSNRDDLLLAIAKARTWVEELVHGRAASFAEIAEREGKAERYVRFLAPLAFVSPRIVLSIADGSLGVHLNVTKLVKLVDRSWTEQERCIF